MTARFLLPLFLAAALSSDSGAAAEAVCAHSDRRLVVLTADAQLLMCDGAQLVRRFGVHLGRGGVGKTRQGDNKVPLGVYALGRPRKSEKFWMFIPVGYPTKEQRKKGFTGQDVGVHGPHQALRWLGPLTNTVSSTAGCIGLGKNADIEEVAGWVTAQNVRTIEIR